MCYCTDLGSFIFHNQELLTCMYKILKLSQIITENSSIKICNAIGFLDGNSLDGSLLQKQWDIEILRV